MEQQGTNQTIEVLEKRIAFLENALSKCNTDSMLNKGGRPLITMSEASQLLGLKKQTISVLVSKGKIPFYKPNGKNIYFDAEELNSWLRRKTNASATHEE